MEIQSIAFIDITVIVLKLQRCNKKLEDKFFQPREEITGSTKFKMH